MKQNPTDDLGLNIIYTCYVKYINSISYLNLTCANVHMHNFLIIWCGYRNTPVLPVVSCNEIGAVRPHVKSSLPIMNLVRSMMSCYFSHHRKTLVLTTELCFMRIECWSKPHVLCFLFVPEIGPWRHQQVMNLIFFSDRPLYFLCFRSRTEL